MSHCRTRKGIDNKGDILYELIVDTAVTIKNWLKSIQQRKNSRGEERRFEEEAFAPKSECRGMRYALIYAAIVRDDV
jgi:hypothetical protein